MVFVIHWHESAMDIHVFPIPIPPPTSFSTRSLWVFPVHQVRALVSCIQPGLHLTFLERCIECFYHQEYSSLSCPQIATLGPTHPAVPVLMNGPAHPSCVAAAGPATGGSSNALSGGRTGAPLWAWWSPRPSVWERLPFSSGPFQNLMS